MTHQKASAQFTFWFEDDDSVLLISDDGTWHKSVTNDIENVLADIDAAVIRDLSNTKIIYRDSDGIWDGITCVKRNGYYIAKFIPLQQTCPDIAKKQIYLWQQKLEKSEIVLFD